MENNRDGESGLYLRRGLDGIRWREQCSSRDQWAFGGGHSEGGTWGRAVLGVPGRSKSISCEETLLYGFGWRSEGLERSDIVESDMRLLTKRRTLTA